MARRCRCRNRSTRRVVHSSTPSTIVSICDCEVASLMMEGTPKQHTGKKQRLVLCFDGTGNKFQGNESDTNIVKIYELLARDDPNQFHYYQRKFSGPS